MSNWSLGVPPRNQHYPYEPIHSRSRSYELKPLPPTPQFEETTCTKSQDSLLEPASAEYPINLKDQQVPGSKRQRWKALRFNGWRAGVRWCAGAAASVLLINIIWTIWASSTYGIEHGIGTIQDGSCQGTKKLSLWLHLAINTLSTILLAASNYTMQCLASPTRDEVDKAHRQHKWLNIGVPSVRNLFHVAKARRVLWWLLAISGIPLHLLYNSAVFSSLSATHYNIFAMSEELALAPMTTLPEDLKLEDPVHNVVKKKVSLAELDGFRSWDNLSNIDCMHEYAQSFLSTRGDVVLIISTIKDNRTVIRMADGGEDGTAELSFDWMCKGRYGFIQGPGTGDFCVREALYKQASNWTLGIEHKDGLYPVQYCLSRPVEEHCSVQFSVVILAIVIIANAVKMFCMLSTLWWQRQHPLVTLGDAIQSFLQFNDETTVNNCLASQDQFRGKKPSWVSSARPWHAKKRFWFRGASLTRWLVCNILCIITLSVAGGLLASGFQNVLLESHTFAHIWSLGIGAVSAESMTKAIDYNSMPPSSALFLNILIANSPQALLSFLFLTYNSLYTCMLMTQEWFDFAKERKTLRVTDPVGGQRSTYRLQLPYRYGIPLLILSGILHWLVSQSLFLIKIQGYDEKGTKSDDVNISILGYSAIALMFTIILGGVAILVGILIGFRRYNGKMPLAGSCSAAISAACHQPGHDEDAAVKPLMWGVADEKMRHCSFTSLDAGAPQEGGCYAGDLHLS